MNRRLLWKPLLLALCVLGASADAPAQAQQVSPQLQRALSRAWDAADSGRPKEAVAMLEEVRSSTAAGTFQRALVDQQLGHLYLANNDARKALQSFQASTQNPELPREQRIPALYMLAQLQVDAGALQQARQATDELLALAPAESKYLGLSAYVAYLQEDYSLALEHVQMALANSPDPPKSWLQIALNVYIAREDWARARPFVRELIEKEPANPEYWQYMIQLELKRGSTDGALHAMALAYLQQVLPPEQLKMLAQLWAQYGVPEKAARLLAEWMQSGKLPSNGESLEMRGRFWLLARETDHAVDDLSAAAKLGGRNAGRLHQLVGEIEFRDRHWSEAVSALSAALASGQLSDPNRTRLLLGVAAYQGGMKDLARRTLTPLRQAPAQRDQANYWLSKLDA